MNQEALHKEIDLIQACINRMANNSFLLKGWAVTIVAAVLTLSEDKFDPALLLCAIGIPIFCFWYLSTFFLWTEKKYRKMYEWVIRERKKDNLEFQYDLNPKRFNKNVDSFCKVMFSKTLLLFYGLPLLVVAFIIIYQIVLCVVL